MIFPTRDGELEFWAQHKDEFYKNDISVVVSNLKTIQVCLNKLDFYNFGLKNRFNFIETYESMKDLPKSDKYVVKKKFGSGSKDIYVGLAFNELEEFNSESKKYIYQPFIEGMEFSADAWLNKKSEVKGLILSKRDLVVNGESQVTTTFINKKLKLKFQQY